ncbi:HpcH/HpaI aldolase/citrate lyase family protein [Falsochrobactrum sp. TDYN1]|uniref:HpcH/HpaI aldolase/citrate lyase family protein n=1 Tax=Falsochrobactrum tianjinense TaxID=2706015 RepID=A0A949PLG1_9HYPH|nr:HpcH/HpaI aldolase/citrate lyase family protein [Falsochrobactrum sp. TDYN1]MBV2143407.1 HpcH/HpaI aldolase/citrate lyase family protein [Falsochrobactrum sp. TDYN1]
MGNLNNPLKQALSEGRLQTGLWCSLGSPVSTEVIAGSGFDWLLVDAEHSPNDLLSVLAQHQAASAFDCEMVVRIPGNDPILIKQYLDIGIRSILFPNVQSVEEAKAIVSATRYPPHGIRGFSMSQRANQYGRVRGYHARASEEIFLALQIETGKAVAAAADIAAIDGVDAVFVGPGDLSADMGALGNPSAEHVQEAIRSVVSLKGRAATGILAPKSDDARRYINWGATMVAVGSDLGLLVNAADSLAAQFQPLK